MCQFCEEYNLWLTEDKKPMFADTEHRYGVALVSQGRRKGAKTGWRGQITCRPNFHLHFCPECGRPLKRTKYKMSLKDFEGVLKAFADTAFQHCDNLSDEYTKRYTMLMEAAHYLAVKHSEAYSKGDL